MAIATPVMLLLISLMVLAGRVAVAGNTVTTVAGNAAREASLARTAGAASAAATSSARAALAAQAINCQGGGNVSVDVSGFGAAARGVPGQVVTVSIVCDVVDRRPRPARRPRHPDPDRAGRQPHRPQPVGRCTDEPDP